MGRTADGKRLHEGKSGNENSRNAQTEFKKIFKVL
jgi:hypothetical protein